MGISRLVTVICAFALYSATMCRWIGAGDTAIVIWNMDQLILSTHVNNHAAMVGIGWAMLELIPWGDPAWKANWFSVLFGTGVVCMFHIVVSRILRDPLHTFLASAVLAVTHTFWWHSTIVENYALNGVMTLLVAWMLFREHETGRIGWLYAAAPVAGLAVLNHAQMGFLAPVLGGYALARGPYEVRTVLVRWALLAAGWFAGLIPYLGLGYWNTRQGHDGSTVVKNAIGSHFTEIMFDLKIWEIGSIFWREILVQFPSPVLLALPVGIVLSFRRNERWPVHAGLLAGFVVNSGFFMTYNTWDRFAFLLPSYAILLIWLTEGWAFALRWAREHRPRGEAVLVGVALLSIAMPPVVYRELPRLGKAGWFWHGRFSSNGQWNTHDVATYLANPDKSAWNDLDRLNQLLLDKLPKRAVVIDDDGRNHYTLNLYYQNVLKQRRDVRALLVNAWGFEGWGQDKAKLADKLLKWRKSSPVFAMTLMRPHRLWQGQLADEGLGPVPWYLEDDVWIYAFEDRPRGSADPFFWEIHTGLRLEGEYPVMTWQLGAGERGQVRVRIRESDDAHEAVLRFTPATGEPVEVPIAFDAKSERTVVQIPDAVMGSPGRWRIEVVYDGTVETWLMCTIQERAVDRRYR